MEPGPEGQLTIGDARLADIRGQRINMAAGDPIAANRVFPVPAGSCH